MPLMGSLYVGASGLTTSQNALNTTAHNLSNIDTTGYTRQQVLQGNRTYNTVGYSYNNASQVGLGVSYTDVRSIRDYFLDQAYRTENGRSEYYSTSYSAISEVETYFGETEGTAFQTALQDLTTTIEELKKDPSNATNQGLLVSKAATFLERSQAVYDGLAEYQDNLNDQVKGEIEDINTYGQKIYDLNQQIKKIETGGIEDANDLRDARNELLDKLSGLAKISYSEDSTGVVTVQIEGVDFVTDDYVNQMGYTTDAATGFYTPTWPRLKDQSVFSSNEEISSDLGTDIGSLKALVNARGTKRATFEDLDGALNADGETNYEKKIQGSVLMNVMAEFDNLVHGIVTGMNDILTSSDSSGNTVNLFEKVDSAGKWTTDNLTINSDVKQTPTKLDNGFVNADYSVNQSDADALSSLFSNTFSTLNPTTKTQLTFSSYYTALIADNATTGSTYKAIAANEATTVTSIDNQRQQVVGVSDNEELTSMVRFQNAYNASSRYINTVNEMLDTLINGLQ